MHLLILSLLLLFGHRHPTHAERAMPPFYEITQAGTTDTSYLFGTLHLLEGGYVDTMPRIMYALHRSDAVIGEILDSVTVDAVQDLLSGPSLDSILTTSQYKKVGEALKTTAHLPIEFLDRMAPVIVQAIILEGLYQKAHPENHKTGIPMDLYFQREAKTTGKTVMALEEASAQEQALDSIPIAEQVSELMELVDHPKQQVRELDNMLKKYSAGKVEEILDDPTLGALSPGEMQSLLFDRNSKWIDELPKMLSEHRCFIAVGAGHLVGKHGLVEGLRAKGYDVKRSSPYYVK
jgi:uncharacterized protein YbaP (TraB family)